LGVGPEPVPRKKLTVDRLTQAIQIVTSDEAPRKRSAAVGEQIRAEDGVGQAVAIIELTLKV
jgi:sterol 3beta-glucosyltransferase